MHITILLITSTMTNILAIHRMTLPTRSTTQKMAYFKKIHELKAVLSMQDSGQLWILTKALSASGL